MSDELIEQLERFVFDNPALERLEALLDDFNPFVAMRWTRQEIRHSSFLRWLLDPTETHGLGSYFLRLFLKHAVYSIDSNRDQIPSVIDIDAWTFDSSQVLQEWNNIDILIRDDSIPLVVVIENKVDTGEHSDQLRRYRRHVNAEFGSHRQIYILLAVDGSTPSDENYISVTYSEIVELIISVLDRRQDQIGSEVTSFLRYYVEMLRRHIVEDSEIQAICRQIYKTHQRALDVIFEHRPDRPLAVSEFLQDLINSTPELQLDGSSKSYVRFAPTDLEYLPRHGGGWTKSKRLLIFEIDQTGGDVRIKFVLGPGTESSRKKIYAIASKNERIFNRATSKFYSQFWSFHIERWISKKEYEETELEKLKERLREKIFHFLNTQLPPMLLALTPLKESDWIEQETS